MGARARDHAGRGARHDAGCWCHAPRPALSALGLLTADHVVDDVEAITADWRTVDAAELSKRARTLLGRAVDAMRDAGVPEAQVSHEWRLNLVYPGQTFDTALPIAVEPDGEVTSDAVARTRRGVPPPQRGRASDRGAGPGAHRARDPSGHHRARCPPRRGLARRGRRSPGTDRPSAAPRGRGLARRCARLRARGSRTRAERGRTRGARRRVHHAWCCGPATRATRLPDGDVLVEVGPATA